MALTADGGSSTTTDVISTSSGDTEVTSLDTSDSTSAATIIQEGGGTTTVSSSTLNIAVRHAGTFVPTATVTLLSSVGTITRPGAVLLSVLDSFSDASIDPMWSQVASGDTLSETGDIVTIGFATGADARLTFGNVRNHPRMWTKSPYANMYSVVAVVRDITFTTPTAGDIYTGLLIRIGESPSTPADEEVYLGIAVERRSNGDTNLVTVEINDDATNDLVNYGDRTTLASTTDVWLRMDVLGDADDVDPRAYFRTSAPTQSSLAFTLLAAVDHTESGVTQIDAPLFRIYLASWETQDSDGVVTANYEKFEITPLLGPG